MRQKRMIGFVVLLMSAGVLAEQVTVNRNRVDILKGKGSIFLPPITTVTQGTELTVLDHEGRWLHVSYNGTEGYVLVAALNGEAEAASGESSGGSNEATAAAAAKGWDSNTFARHHGYSKRGLEIMMATRARLAANPERFEQFKERGHVGAQ